MCGLWGWLFPGITQKLVKFWVALAQVRPYGCQKRMTEKDGFRPFLRNLITHSTSNLMNTYCVGLQKWLDFDWHWPNFSPPIVAIKWLKISDHYMEKSAYSDFTPGGEVYSLMPLAIGQLAPNFSDIYMQKQNIYLKKIHRKMLSAKCRPFWSDLNVLIDAIDISMASIAVTDGTVDFHNRCHRWQ